MGQKSLVVYVFLILLTCSAGMAQKMKTIYGFVKDANTTRGVPNVNVYIPNSKIETTTDQWGNFKLLLYPPIKRGNKVSVVFEKEEYRVKKTFVTSNGRESYKLTISLLPINTGIKLTGVVQFLGGQGSKKWAPKVYIEGFEDYFTFAANGRFVLQMPKTFDIENKFTLNVEHGFSLPFSKTFTNGRAVGKLVAKLLPNYLVVRGNNFLKQQDPRTIAYFSGHEQDAKTLLSIRRMQKVYELPIPKDVAIEQPGAIIFTIPGEDSIFLAYRDLKENLQQGKGLFISGKLTPVPMQSQFTKQNTELNSLSLLKTEKELVLKNRLELLKEELKVCQHWVVFNNIGATCMKLGRQTQNIGYFVQAVYYLEQGRATTQTTPAELTYNLNLAQRLLKHNDTRAKASDEMINSKPAYPQYKEVIDRYNASLNFFRVSTRDDGVLKEIEDLSTSKGFVSYHNKGLAQLLQRVNYDAAIASFVSAIAHNPKSALSHYLLAICYGKKGDRANMLDYLKRSCVLDSSFKKRAITEVDFDAYLTDPAFMKIVN